MGPVSQANMEVEMAESAWDKTRRTNMVNLLADVEAAGGITVMPMWQVRDAACWDKLGTRVITDIANLLSHHGMASLPAGQPLPLSQDQHVRIYSQRSRVGALADAILEPSGKGDQILREAGTNDAGDVLDRVRALVCE